MSLNCLPKPLLHQVRGVHETVIQLQWIFLRTGAEADRVELQKERRRLSRVCAMVLGYARKTGSSPEVLDELEGLIVYE